VVQVGSGAKTTAQTAAAKQIIKSGALGKVNQIRMENHRSSAEGAWVYPVPPDASEKTIDWARFIGPAPKKSFDPNVFFRWRCWWEYSGGVATDLFVHLLTGMHEFMDVAGPKSVVSQGGIYRWNDGRAVPDLMQSIFEYPEGFLASMHVNLGNGRGSGSSTIISGSEGTLVFEGRGKLVLYPEVILPNVQRYGSLAWPKAMRSKYFEENGCNPDGSWKTPPPPAKPMQEIAIERRVSHQELFVRSVRDGLPSEESAAVGHAAAGSAHLANLAFRKGRRMYWDVKTGKVSSES
jgi:predicted dehydrogenase